VKQLGMKLVGLEPWKPTASSYKALMQRVARSGADALVLAGLIDENGAQVIQDKVSVLGPNTGRVKLYGSDGFTTQYTIDEAGPASYGMVVTVNGVPLSALPAKGRAFARQLASRVGGTIDPYAVSGAQVAEVLLDAISRSDGTRTSILSEIRRTDIRNGYIGHVRFRKSGDPVYSSGFTAYRLTSRGLVTARVIRPTGAEVRRMTGP
jgi:branched-chain amino acid transport system substrate-binding protein